MRQAIKGLGLSALCAVVAIAFTLPVSAAETAAPANPAWAADYDAGKMSAAKGENAKAKEQLEKALKAADAANDDQGIAQICNELANIYMAEGDIVNASANAKRAKDSALKILMATPATRALAESLAKNEANGSIWINHMMRGQFAIDRKDLPAAENEFNLALAKAREYAADGMPTASALGGLGKTLVLEGKYKEAEPVLREAISLCEKNWTPVTRSAATDAAEAMDNLALVLENTGKKDEAAAMAARAKEVRETKTLKGAANKMSAAGTPGT
jgi:tetratricopeptide (TPR) repeat protein